MVAVGVTVEFVLVKKERVVVVVGSRRKEL